MMALGDTGRIKASRQTHVTALSLGGGAYLSIAEIPSYFELCDPSHDDYKGTINGAYCSVSRSSSLIVPVLTAILS